MSKVMLLLAILLTACAMGPDYTRPTVSAPESFRMAGKEGESIANLPWWELLRDDELQKLVRIALNENKDLKQAVASVEEYQARLYIARTDFAPQLSVSGNAPLAKMGGVGFPGFPSSFSYYGQGSLSWELDFWGRVRRENEAARADLLAREENRRAVVLQLVSSVAQAYFDLRQLDMQLDIARRTLQSWEESVKIAQARLRQGLIPKLDLDQFEAERANAAARTAELERQMIQKEDELSVLLGRNPAQIPRGRLLTEQVMPPKVPAGLPSELLHRRPDVLQGSRRRPGGCPHGPRAGSGTGSPGDCDALGLAPCRAALQRRDLQLSGRAHVQAESLRRRTVAHGHPPAPSGVHRPALQGPGRGVDQRNKHAMKSTMLWWI